MTSIDLVPDRRPSYLRDGSEILIDYRRRRELDAAARLERKRIEISEQTSDLNAPSARIRAWEAVHSLRMPSSPAHAILGQIAITTQLSMAEVLEEQRVRSVVATS